MRKNTFCFLCTIAISFTGRAQLYESFSDGNFTHNPVWQGNTPDWQIAANSDVAGNATNSNTLRLNAAGGSISYLCTQISGTWAQAQVWSVFIGRRNQAYTSLNSTFIWLWANESDLTNTTTIDGYRIRIGDDAGGDNIVLQRVDNGIPTDIILSTGSIPNGLTDIGFLLRVTRSVTGGWEILTSALPGGNGTGAIATDVPDEASTNVSQGTAVDNTYFYFNNGFIGFANTYTSGTNARSTQEFDQLQFSFSGYALPVKLLRFDAAPKDNTGVNLVWEAPDELGVITYEIQRSTNGVQFTAVGTVTATQSKKYSYTDPNTTGSGFYRLRILDHDGTYRMSHIVSIKSKGVIAIKATPNPVKSILNVDHPKAAPGTTIHIFNAAGVVVRKVTVPENAVLSPVDFTTLQGGLYHIVFRSKDQVLSLAVVKQ